MKMEIIFLLQLLSLSYWAFADAECPMNLQYVRNLPWDKASCESPISDGNHSPCCHTLLSLFGVGLAQYLRDASVFGLPTNASAVACLKLFQQQLDSLGILPDLVTICLENGVSGFVSSPLLCAGIQTKQDWISKVGISNLDSACKGDLSDLAACQACKDNGDLVQMNLVDMYKNLTSWANIKKCYNFTLLYAAGVVNEFGPKNPNTAQCILRLPFVQTASQGRVVTYGFLGAVVLLVICVIGLLYCLWVRRKNRKAAQRGSLRLRNEKLLTSAVKRNSGVVWFGIEEIKVATDNFSDVNQIGQGSFGTVYKGTLDDGRRIAVKRIRNCTPERDSEFLNEVEIISNIRHRNLVALSGCCIASDEREGHQRFQVYDYMPNGNLDEHLFGEKSMTQPLMWPQRRNIVMEIAKGLAYLHDEIEPAIYHRGIKATNILLDDDMNARVADFGLARIMTKEGGESQIRGAGTPGYLAPECALYGQLTDKSDVYSFGILLLEIMSGRKARDNSAESASHYLVTDWAWAKVKEGRTCEIIDERIRQSGVEAVMERFVLVGILCAHVIVAFRPGMVEAVKMLEGEAEVPEIADRPLPLMHHGISILAAE